MPSVRVFSSQMAGRTQTNEVGHYVGREIVNHTKVPKSDDVMHVQLFAERGFRDSTLPAGIAIAASGVPSLRPPVGAIVRHRSTAPRAIVRATILSGMGTPIGIVAGSGATSPVLSMSLRYGKETLAHRAPKRNPPLQIGPFTHDCGTRYAFQRCSKVLAEAGTRTESVPAPSRAADSFATYLACLRCKLNDAKIGFRVYGSRASARTVRARPGLVIPELLAAFWAACRDTAGGTETSSRAMAFHAIRIPARVVIEGLAACGAGAGCLWHGIAPRLHLTQV